MSANNSSPAKTALVIGASGFLGSHLVRELYRQHYQVRILVRASSNIDPIKDIPFEKYIGDVSDVASMKAAMNGCDYVFHSAVNTSAWLNDSGPLYETNVLGVVNAVKAAQATDIKRFVLTSSLVTIGRNANGMSSEEDFPSRNELFTAYMKTRFLAEKYVLDAFKDSGFPGIAGCVSNTYGDFDAQPTPHGNLVKQVALGRVPVYFDAASEVVGVEDAAQGLILAAEKGRPGERYIISESYTQNKDLFAKAAQFAGVKAPRFVIPKPLLLVVTTLVEAFCRLTGLESVVNHNSVKLIYQTWSLSNEKAKKELGWNPAPIDDAIKRAVTFYKNNR